MPQPHRSTTSTFDPIGHAKLPVVCVDWCDALAFCTAAQKRLCGKIGGGSAPFPDGDATTSEWMAACSLNGANDYPYGDAFAPMACNGKYGGPSQPIDVGSKAACVGGFPSLLDMSGNVAELEDSVVGSVGAMDPVRARGGDFMDGAPGLACAALYQGGDVSRSFRAFTIGFRCCADLVTMP
ncbi:MAG: SUMF1/EgtB/PvdO family nonheme iron enzyme [Polyangiaceae bacterium]